MKLLQYTLLLALIAPSLLCQVTSSPANTTEPQVVNVYCHCAGADSAPPKPSRNATAPASPQPPATQPPTTQPPPTFVAFSVGNTNRFHVSPATQIPFNTVLYNDGRHFHTDNAFYAPFNGIYAFTFSAMSEGSYWVRIVLHTKKPGQPKVAVAQAMDFGASGGYGTASGSVMLRLEPGETVSLWTDGTSQKIIGTTPPSTLFVGELKQRLD